MKYPDYRKFEKDTKGKLFKLTKLKSLNLESRQVNEGDTTTGEAMLVGSSLMFGRMLIVGDIRTSEVQKIEKNDNSYVITTKNSLYTLVEENNV